MHGVCLGGSGGWRSDAWEKRVAAASCWEGEWRMEVEEGSEEGSGGGKVGGVCDTGGMVEMSG